MPTFRYVRHRDRVAAATPIVVDVAGVVQGVAQVVEVVPAIVIVMEVVGVQVDPSNPKLT